MSCLVAKAITHRRTDCPAGVLGLVFPNGKGNPEPCGNIMRRVFYLLQIEAGFTNRDGAPRYGFHALRHACASLTIEQGWPVKKIQAAVSHSSVTMTLDVSDYLFTKAEDDAALVEKMEQDLMAE